MQFKLVIAIAILFIVAVTGAILIATPSPSPSPTPTPSPTPGTPPFTSDNVVVTDPLPNATVQKTFTVKGQARGIWYFEASFPVQVRDPQNNVVAQTHAEAQSDWMTTEFVPFISRVSVADYTGPAVLVLLKDNPSGLPEHDDSVEFPIIIQ